MLASSVRSKGCCGAFEGCLLVTTIPSLMGENWIKFYPVGNYRGKLLMISEGEILYNGDTKD